MGVEQRGSAASLMAGPKLLKGKSFGAIGTVIEFSPIRPLYAAIALACWQSSRYSPSPQAVPPQELRQENTESRQEISRTSLGARQSIPAEPASRNRRERKPILLRPLPDDAVIRLSQTDCIDVSRTRK